MDKTLEALIGKQRAGGMTDTQMADALGVSRVHYNYIKNEKASLNDKFIMKVYRAFPDIFLSSEFTKVKSDSTEVIQNGPDKPPSKNLLRLWSKAVVFLTGWVKPPVN